MITIPHVVYYIKNNIDLLAQVNDLKTLKAVAKTMGMTDSEIKKELG